MKRLLVRWNLLAFRACVIATNLLLAGLVINNLAEMTARGFFGRSLDWVFEINVLLAVWLYFLGIYQVYFKRGDIAVEVLMRKTPPAVRHATAVAVDVAIVGVLLMLCWQSLRLIEVQWPFRTPGMRLPNPLFTLPVLLGAALMALTMLERLLGRFGPQGRSGAVAQSEPWSR